MAERTTIARPYADAAFETAREANELPAWSEMLKLAEAIATDERMAEALAVAEARRPGEDVAVPVDRRGSLLGADAQLRRASWSRRTA